MPIRSDQRIGKLSLYDSSSLPCTLSSRTDCLRHRSQAYWPPPRFEYRSDKFDKKPDFPTLFTCLNVTTKCATIQVNNSSIRTVQHSVQNRWIKWSSA